MGKIPQTYSEHKLLSLANAENLSIQVTFLLSPLMHVRKVVIGFGKKIVSIALV